MLTNLHFNRQISEKRSHDAIRHLKKPACRFKNALFSSLTTDFELQFLLVEHSSKMFQVLYMNVI